MEGRPAVFQPLPPGRTRRRSMQGPEQFRQGLADFRFRAHLEAAATRITVAARCRGIFPFARAVPCRSRSSTR